LWERLLIAKEELAKYTIGISSYYATQAVLKTHFPVVLGVLPLKHVREIEVARSGKILKFRAIGSIFLASQKGGEDAVTITGLIYKGEVLLLLGLWALFLCGIGRIEDLNIIEKLQKYDPTAIRKLVDVKSYNKNRQSPTYEYHLTFPFVSKHFIIPNCYIETISFEEKLPLKDVIQYTVALRTFTKQNEFTGFKKRNGTVYYGEVPQYFGWKKVLEFSANVAWRTFQATNAITAENEWRIKPWRLISIRTQEEQDDIRLRVNEFKDRNGRSPNENEKKAIVDRVLGRNDDTYYTVNPIALASTMALVMSGVHFGL